MKSLVAHAMAILLAAVAAGDDAVVKSLSPATALADVRAHRGVVFVDLYADW